MTELALNKTMTQNRLDETNSQLSFTSFISITVFSLAAILFIGSFIDKNAYNSDYVFPCMILFFLPVFSAANTYSFRRAYLITAAAGYTAIITVLSSHLQSPVDEILTASVGLSLVLFAAELLFRLSRNQATLSTNAEKQEILIQNRTTHLRTINESLMKEIKHRNRIEERLFDESLFREQLIQNMFDGLCVFNQSASEPYLHFSVWNQRMGEITGYSLDEINETGLCRLIDRVNPQTNQPCDRIHDWFDGSTLEREELRIRTKSGSIRLIELSTVLIDKKDDDNSVMATIRDVTEDRKQQEELWNSKEMLQKVIDNIPQAVFWKDRKSVYEGCNQHFASDSGAGASKTIVGKTDFDLRWPDETSYIFRADDRHVMDSNTPKYRYRERIHTEEKGERWLETNKIPLHDKNGNVNGLLGTYQDITEQLVSERELKRRLKLLETVASISSEIISERYADLDRVAMILGQTLKSDRAYIFEYNEEHTLMTNTVEWCAPGVEAQNEGLKNLNVDDMPWWTGRIFNRETILIEDVNSLGEDARAERDLFQQLKVRSLMAVPIRSRDDRLFGFLGFDIIQGKRTWEELDNQILKVAAEMIAGEFERREAQLKLNRQYDNLNSIIENMPDAVFAVDNDNRLIAWNQAMEAMSGLKSRDMVGKHIHEVSCCFYEKDRPLLLELLDASDELVETMYDQADRRHDGWFVETFVPNLYDGEGAYVWATATPIKTESGERIGAIETVRDVSEAVELQNEKRQLAEQVQQASKMEAIGLLAGGVAHDFNNLLTGIIGYSELLLSRTDAEDRIYQPLTQIKRAGDSAASLTRQLLAFSRKQTLKPIAVQLNDLVEQIEKMIQRLIGEDIELSISLDDELGCVKADPTQLEQILFNLAVNARDAMPRGGSLTIRTKKLVPGCSSIHEDCRRNHAEHVMITVTDTGHGMDHETQKRIFDPFFTTKEVGKGTGLGLSTVYGIVKQSDGCITVNSKPDVGTTFTVFLPAIKKEAAKTPEAVESVDLNGDETILMVEDDPVVRLLLKEALESYGYSCLEAENPHQGIFIIENRLEDIDMVITDVVMPKMNGRDMANHIAEIAPDMPLLFISGYATDSLAERGFVAKEIELLSKPFSPLDAIKRIRGILDASQKRRSQSSDRASATG